MARHRCRVLGGIGTGNASDHVRLSFRHRHASPAEQSAPRSEQGGPAASPRPSGSRDVAQRPHCPDRPWPAARVGSCEGRPSESRPRGGDRVCPRPGSGQESIGQPTGGDLGGPVQSNGAIVLRRGFSRRPAYRSGRRCRRTRCARVATCTYQFGAGSEGEEGSPRLGHACRRIASCHPVPTRAAGLVSAQRGLGHRYVRHPRRAVRGRDDLISGALRASGS